LISTQHQLSGEKELISDTKVILTKDLSKSLSIQLLYLLYQWVEESFDSFKCRMFIVENFISNHKLIKPFIVS